MDSTPTSDIPFPPSPKELPPGLAKASAKYRWHAWLALLGLFLFALIYVGLIGWFGYSSYRLGTEFFEGGGGLLEMIEAFCSAVITVFLVKGLFFRKHSGSGGGFEITANDEPKLFEFINSVADETSAPRPHKVYLSASVNACVFYDLSLLNFLFPTKKNLEIGLGLTNVLNLSEFKAVLSHEFGHFAQKSMAVGRWVYTAQQVANQLIYHRDALDRLLNFISSIDLRIAWIGWVLRLVVWSLRSILDSLLGIVTMAERALSREMEFQADLVAVSTTGSDALIHGLFRLPAADQAWDEALGFIGKQIDAGHKPEDVFAIQTRILEHKKRILDDPEFGEAPPMPDGDAAQHRIFSADIAQPPQMWATHPLSHLREANAKQTYVPAELDRRSAWSFFTDPEKLRKKFSAYLFEELDQKLQPLEETLVDLDKSYAKEFYNPKYRGIYLERSTCDHAATSGELFDEGTTCDPDELYPASLVDDLEKLRNVSKEKAMLVALRDRNLETPDGIIRFRGDVIKRSDLGEAIETSTKDLEKFYDRLAEHDRKCRSYHLNLAGRQPGDWSSYLKGLISLLHFADHKLRDLLDANGKLNNTFAVVMADGNVSSKEMVRLMHDSSILHRNLNEVFMARDKVLLDANLQNRMNAATWKEVFEDNELGLPSPSQEIMGEWLQAVDSWVGAACEPLSCLLDAVLEELLETEAMLREAAETGTELADPPAPSSAPAAYRTLVHGRERSLQQKLNLWDSFQTASGFGPAAARFMVSFTIIFAAVYLTLPPKWKAWLLSLIG